MKIAIQDDMEVWRTSISCILKHHGCEVEEFLPNQTISIEQANKYDVIIMDNVLGVSESGYERLCDLRSKGYEKGLILYTATPNDVSKPRENNDIHIVSKKDYIDKAIKRLGFVFA